MSDNRGVTITTLMIAIVVMAALAAMAIYNGVASIEKAQLMRYTNEAVEIEDKVLLATFDLEANFARRGIQKPKEEIYLRTALGLGMNGEIPENAVRPIPAEYLDKLAGTRCYEFVSGDEFIGNKKDFEKIFITDQGEVFFEPGYLVKQENSQRVYINGSTYVTYSDF